jgi:hypothetical protein
MLREVTSLRKLGHFFAMLFPPLGHAWDRATGRLARAAEGPRTRAFVRRLENEEGGRALVAVVRQFFWDDYRGDRVSWARYSAEAVAILRPVFLLSLAVTVLTPVLLALAPHLPSLPQASVDGAGGPVALPSVALWTVALAGGWGCVLAGAAFCNRAASVLAVTFYVYLVAWLPFAWSVTPPSYGNALVPLAALLSLGFAERRASRAAAAAPSARDRTAAGVHAVLGSLVCGNATVAMTPLVHWVPGHALHFGLALSGLMAILVLALGRRGERPAEGTVPRLALALAAMTAAGSAWAALRGDLAGMVGGAIASHRLLLSYLWPVWYLVGVGAIFGVLKSTKVVAGAVRAIAPPRAVPLLAALFFVVGALACWGEALLAPRWPASLATIAVTPYRLSRHLLWHVPERALSAGWVRWVFLGDVLAVVGLVARRRFGRDVAMELLSGTLLATFAVFTYFSQTAGMAHASGGPVSPWALFGFMAWLSWMLQKFALRFGATTSPSWPDLGRLAMAGGFLVLVLAALLARFAAHDGWVRDQLFLYLLRGVVDVGLPYALYVYADRRVAELPLGAGPLFLAFAAGALASMPLVALDRLAAAGSWSALQTALTARADAILAGQLTTAEPSLPTAYLAARGALVVGGLLLVALVVSRPSRPSGLAAQAPHRGPRVLFAVVAAGAGLASFTRSTLELPFLTERWQLLFARSPDGATAQIDWELFASTFAFTLPALVLALFATGRRRAGALVGALAAYGVHLGVTLGWQHHEAYLRSSGILGVAAAALFGAMGGGIAIARRRVEASTEPDPAAGAPAQASVVTVPIALLGTGALAGLVAFGWVLSVRARPVLHAIPDTTASLSIPSAWAPASAAPPGLAFRQPSSAGTTSSILLAGRDRLLGRAPAEHLTHLVEQGTRNLPRFRAMRIESWERHAQGAWAVDYAFQQAQKDGTMLPVAGTTAVVPLDGDDVLVLTLLATFPDRDRLRWDLALAAQRLATHHP